MVESTYTALGGTGFGMPPESANAPLTVDDLPRLTDDEREALDSGLIAMEGVPAAAELQRFHRQSSGRSIGNMPDPLPCPLLPEDRGWRDFDQPGVHPGRNHLSRYLRPLRRSGAGGGLAAGSGHAVECSD
ncbi:MAG: hypothetical protein ABW106_14170 [Steroidobacteraceae bacterium]